MESSSKLYFQSGNNNSFKGKNIIVTGATGGIGSVLVKILHSLGAQLLLISHDEEKLKKTFNSLFLIQKNYDNITAPQYEIIDLENPRQITDFFPNVMKKLKGKLDILLICHGKYSISQIKEANLLHFDSMMNINVRSVFHLISLATPFLKITKGNIVVLSSMEAKIITKFGTLNTITKSMINSLVQCSALELAPFGIRVNAVAPGITNTGHRIGKKLKEEENKEYMNTSGNLFLLGKSVLNPEDIVNSILFLASDDASFVTGEIIENDKGFGLNHDLTFNDDIYD